ncbi:unnamed protein product [Meloidogyne enterolobii]|uniref:Uncharacterized protein n=1 Tax=Meloidogyne enterolobii TaxID=390850 RepID=A0ACB1AQX1_MELEN
MSIIPSRVILRWWGRGGGRARGRIFGEAATRVGGRDGYKTVLFSRGEDGDGKIFPFSRGCREFSKNL